MAKLKTFLALFVGMALLLGCKSGQKAVGDSVLVNVQWHLESATELDAKAFELGINMTFFLNQGEKSVSGFSGCNRFMSGATWDKKKMNFGLMTSTEMYCDGRMETENSFFNLLKGVDSYLVIGEKLLLLKNNTTIATFSKKTKTTEE
jgi:heat shock protein HslJ